MKPKLIDLYDKLKKSGLTPEQEAVGLSGVLAGNERLEDALCGDLLGGHALPTEAGEDLGQRLELHLRKRAVEVVELGPQVQAQHRHARAIGKGGGGGGNGHTAEHHLVPGR